MFDFVLLLNRIKIIKREIKIKEAGFINSIKFILLKSKPLTKTKV